MQMSEGVGSLKKNSHQRYGIAARVSIGVGGIGNRAAIAVAKVPGKTACSAAWICERDQQRGQPVSWVGCKAGHDRGRWISNDNIICRMEHVGPSHAVASK